MALLDEMQLLVGDLEAAASIRVGAEQERQEVAGRMPVSVLRPSMSDWRSRARTPVSVPKACVSGG